jgi:hypothetical protein
MKKTGIFAHKMKIPGTGINLYCAPLISLLSAPARDHKFLPPLFVPISLLDRFPGDALNREASASRLAEASPLF